MQQHLCQAPQAPKHQPLCKLSNVTNEACVSGFVTEVHPPCASCAGRPCSVSASSFKQQSQPSILCSQEAQRWQQQLLLGTLLLSMHASRSLEGDSGRQPLGCCRS